MKDFRQFVENYYGDCDGFKGTRCGRGYGSLQIDLIKAHKRFLDHEYKTRASLEEAANDFIRLELPEEFECVMAAIYHPDASDLVRRCCPRNVHIMGQENLPSYLHSLSDAIQQNWAEKSDAVRRTINPNVWAYDGDNILFNRKVHADTLYDSMRRDSPIIRELEQSPLLVRRAS